MALGDKKYRVIDVRSDTLPDHRSPMYQYEVDEGFVPDGDGDVWFVTEDDEHCISDKSAPYFLVAFARAYAEKHNESAANILRDAIGKV